MHIRAATPADLDPIMDLERSSSTAAHWTEQQYRRVFQAAVGSATTILVAETSPSLALCGFLVARQIAPEWELENIVVAPSSRRKGVGRQLVEALLAHAIQTNSHTVYLEVRESNTAARGLYEKLGFEHTGRRKSYYSNPLEDAIVYRRLLAAPISE